MQTHDIAPHIATLTRALGNKIGTDVSEQDLKDEFAKYLEYGVPADQAIKTILRHHGVQGAAPARAPGSAAPVSQERIPLAHLPPNSPAVNLKVRLLTLNTKEVNVRGEAKGILWGLLGDESGSAAYTAWRPLEGLQKGDVVEIQGAYTKEYNGQVQVNLGDRCKITKKADTDLPRTPETFRDTPLAGLKEGLRGIRVSARILEVASRQVTVQGTPKTLWGGTLADASGKVEFTSWHDHELTAGQAVTIEGGYVRVFRGVPQFNFDQSAKVTPFAGELPTAQTLSNRPPMPVGELVARGGGNDVSLVGTLLEVRPGSGLVFRCSHKDEKSTCGRVLAAGQCRLHSKVEGVPDLRIKGILDDGTGSINFVAGRVLTETLLGKDLESCKAEAQAAFRPEIIHDQLRERLTGRVFALRGNAVSDEFGPMFMARSMTAHREDTAAAAQALLASLPPEAV